jgi:hypothetical protein
VVQNNDDEKWWHFFWFLCYAENKFNNGSEVNERNLLFCSIVTVVVQNNDDEKWWHFFLFLCYAENEFPLVLFLQ